MSDEKSDITIDLPRSGKRPGEFIFVSRNGEPLHSDTFDPAKGNKVTQFLNETFRRAFGAKKADWPRELYEQLQRQFVAWAVVPPAGAAPSATTTPLVEVDVRRVVRPELFHLAEVSGITVPVVTAEGDKLTPRWRTYLRWADGRREVLDRPNALALSDGTRVFVFPDPGEPANEPAAWTTEARRVWETTATAPNPAAVFKQLCSRIAQFIDLGDDKEHATGATAVLALWVLFTYVYPAWDAVPYLYIGGPKGSGKSRLLDVLARLAFRPITTSNLTAPVLFRTLHSRGGTIFFDEAERLRQANDPAVQEINSIFLAGYKKGGTASRLEPVGDSFRSVQFQVYGPKVLACIAGVPDALKSRCITFTMFRAATESKKTKLRIDAEPEVWTKLRNDLHALALEHGLTWDQLANRQDVVPATIANRNFELWQPLCAIAAWLESRGATKLLELVQRFAQSSVREAEDDATSDADEILLEVLTEAVRGGERPTAGSLLKSARERDENTFEKWQPTTVTRRLKNYGIPTPKKTDGVRRFNVSLKMLARIQSRYGIDLGCDPEATKE